jgi:hypothetical protein
MEGVMRMNGYSDGAEATQQVVFEYVGSTSMLAEGMVTRQRYYFPEPGARLPVDLRDRAGLLRAPNLREAP